MKKTFTVNLGGTVFHIDEDAYQLLDKYLSNLRLHFRKEEGSDEIMNDFEMRISELLSDRVRLGYEVITITHVEEVIKRMGKPEEIFTDDSHSHSEFKQEEYKVRTEGTTRRRFYRNPDDRILGGVAGGLAAYMGWDPTAIRIFLFLLMFVYGVTIPIYLVLWMIVPNARTASEKLEMRGESVTVENIGKTVTNGFEKVSNNISDYINSGKPRSTIQKLGDAFVQIVGVILKVFLIILGVILFPPILIVLFVLVVILIALLLGGGVGLLHGLVPFSSWGLLSGYPEASIVIGGICTILLIGIPIIALLYAISSPIFKLKPMPTVIKWVLIILWIGALLINVIFVSNYGLPWYDWVKWGNGWHMNSVGLALSV